MDSPTRETTGTKQRSRKQCGQVEEPQRRIPMVPLVPFARAFDSTTVHDRHLIELGFGFTPFEAFVGCYPARAHVKVVESHTSDVIVITAVATEASTTAVTHPEGGFVVCVLFEHAIVVDMVAIQNQNFSDCTQGGIDTYCPQVTNRTPSSSSASLKPELKPGAVGASAHEPFQYFPLLRYSGNGM